MWENTKKNLTILFIGVPERKDMVHRKCLKKQCLKTCQLLFTIFLCLGPQAILWCHGHESSQELKLSEENLHWRKTETYRLNKSRKSQSKAKETHACPDTSLSNYLKLKKNKFKAARAKQHITYKGI